MKEREDGSVPPLMYPSTVESQRPEIEMVALSRPTMKLREELPKAVVSAVSVVSGKSTELSVSEMLRLDPYVSSIAKSTLLPCTNVGIYGPPRT